MAKAEPIKKTGPEIVTPQVQESGLQNHWVLNPEFTGVARSVECYNNHGHSNFRILTLYVDKGKVIKMDVSDAYTQWEAASRLDLANDNSLINLNAHWQHGKALCK